MRTLVVTGGEKSMWEVLNLTLPSKYRYCQKHGYDILVKRTWTPKPKLGFVESFKHLGFLRVVACYEQLKYYDNVVWLDGDSIITNDSYKIEDFIDEQHCFFASYNWMVPESSQGGPFTTGNFIIKRTPYPQTEELYNTFLQISQHYLDNICQELATLNFIRESTKFKEFIKVLPHKFLNACPDFLIQTQTWINDNNRSGIVAPWNKDCFLAHLTGCSTEERADILKTKFTEYL